MSDTLDAALEGATNDLKSEDDLETSSTEESTEESTETEEDQTEGEESTKDESSEESQDESTEESKEDTKEKESKEDENESFTKIDPNELPEEVKPVYKSLLADYTRKRQQEAQLVKDTMAENEQLKQQLATGGQRGGVQPGQVKIDLTPQQIGEMTLPEYTNYVINQAFKAAQGSQQAKEVKDFESEATTGFLSMDARLNPDLESSYDPRFATNIGNKVDQDYEAHIAKTGSPMGFDWRASAEKHIQEWDEWVAGIKKQSVKETTKVSKQKATKLKKTAPPTTQARSKPSESMDLNGAIDSAFESAAE